MRSDAGQERFCLLGFEPAHQPLHGHQTGEAEPCHRHRVTGNGPQRTQYIVGDGLAVADQWLHEAPVGRPVGSERRHRLVERPKGSHRVAPVDGLGERHRGLAEDVTQTIEGRLTEERGQEHHGVDGRADVVAEAGQGQLLGPASAPGSLGPFDNRDRQPGTGQGHCGRQPVGPGPHHHHIHRVHGRIPSTPRMLIPEVLPPDVPALHIGGFHLSPPGGPVATRWPDDPDGERSDHSPGTGPFRRPGEAVCGRGTAVRVLYTPEKISRIESERRKSEYHDG